MQELLASFDGLEDPRIERTKLFPLTEIMFLILCSVMCGVESWRGVEDFGEDRILWLRKYLPFKNGIPSHQTIGRVMSLLKPKAANLAFIQFISSLTENPTGEIISLDGKTLRHSFDNASGQKAIHILNAFAVNSGLVLGQLKVDVKTNEIIAVPELLDLIDFKYATIVADAMNTQKKIATKIVENSADYALPVKGNHKQLEIDIIKEFESKNIDIENKNIYK